MALSAGTYQGRIGSRTYSMRRHWPEDIARSVPDYSVMVSGRAGVGHCGCPGEGMAGLGVAAPAWTSDPTLIVGYWTQTNGPTFVVTPENEADPSVMFGPGTFSATDPRTGELAPGLAARAQRLGMTITVAGVVTVLGLAVFAMRRRG